MCRYSVHPYGMYPEIRRQDCADFWTLAAVLCRFVTVDGGGVCPVIAQVYVVFGVGVCRRLAWTLQPHFHVGGQPTDRDSD